MGSQEEMAKCDTAAASASVDISEVPEWEPRRIPRAPSGLPIAAYTTVKNSVCEPPSDLFDVRGPTYLADKKKVTALQPIFSLVDVRPFSHKTPVWHAAATLKPLRDYIAAHPNREFFIANRVLPLEKSVHVIAVFVRTQAETVDPVFERSWKRFKDGDADYRNHRLKYMAKIPNASFMVRSSVGALGGFRPVIMGKGYLELKHFTGANYTEVDIDIGSSRIARGVVGVIIPQGKKMIIDEAFFIEGQQDDELPERLLGLCRCAHYDLDSNTLPISEDMLVEDPCGGSADGVTRTASEPNAARDSGCADSPSRAHSVPGPRAASSKGSPLSGADLHDQVVNELGAAYDVEAGVAVLAADSLGNHYDDTRRGDSKAQSPDAISANSDGSDDFFDAQ
eukprot:m.191427 g.191427  ORF g.191427 m.191427 type:complete len:395 (-) comp24921_c0_seq1:2100-3284(-)